jgi:phosphoesterase RecJ-like protein
MTLEIISNQIQNSHHIALMGHRGGDSDCYGAMFGLKLGLESLGKTVEIISTEDFPEGLSFLFYYFPGEIRGEYVPGVDLFIALDSSEVKRLVAPEIANTYKEDGTSIVHLDHHVPGDLEQFADSSYINMKVSSTSEIVYRLLVSLDVVFDKNMSTCLLAGIVGDTSSFQNQNTTGESFAIASELMKRGARLNSIIAHTFGGKEVDVLKIWGLAMERLQVDQTYGVVTTYLMLEDVREYGLSPEAVSGVVNFLNSIKGARVVALITEEEEGSIKVSLRTRDEHANVASIARQLGGGGHVKAAGFTFPGHLKMLTQGKNSSIVIV